MKKNAVVGFALVLAAGVLAGIIVASDGGIFASLFGKALWYGPYAALVVGIRKLAVARR